MHLQKCGGDCRLAKSEEHAACFKQNTVISGYQPVCLTIPCPNKTNQQIPLIRYPLYRPSQQIRDVMCNIRPTDQTLLNNINTPHKETPPKNRNIPAASWTSLFYAARQGRCITRTADGRSVLHKTGKTGLPCKPKTVSIPACYLLCVLVLSAGEWYSSFNLLNLASHHFENYNRAYISSSI